MQFSLKWLFVLVGFVAVSCFALLNATPVVYEAYRSSVVLILFVSVLGAIYRSDRARAFCIGFALFGFGNLPVNLPAFGIGEEGGGFNVAGASERVAEVAWQYAHREYTHDEAIEAGWLSKETSPNFDVFLGSDVNSAGQRVYPFPKPNEFGRVFGKVITIALTLLGGLIAQALYVREQRKGRES